MEVERWGIKPPSSIQVPNGFFAVVFDNVGTELLVFPFILFSPSAVGHHLCPLIVEILKFSDQLIFWVEVENHHNDRGKDKCKDVVKNLLLQKNQELLKLRERKDQFLNGKASASFISDALFEMNPILHSFAIKLSQP